MRESGNAAMPLALQERDYIVTILKKCDGRIWGPGGAAEILNLPSTTLRSKMKKLGIDLVSWSCLMLKVADLFKPLKLTFISPISWQSLQRSIVSTCLKGIFAQARL